MYLWTDPTLLRKSLRRWLGSKLRHDRYEWTRLQEAGYAGFVRRVEERLGREHAWHLSDYKETAKRWRELLGLATYDEMSRLRSTILEDMIR